MSLRLNASVAGHIAFEPKPSASRWYGRQATRRSIAREDGQDGHGLAELPEAGDEAAARECDVVRVRRDEDVGHGRASIPTVPGGRGSAGVTRPTRPHR